MSTRDEMKKKLEAFKAERKKIADEEKRIRSEAKELGISLKSEKIPDTPEVKLLKDSFIAVIEANRSLIDGLFKATVTLEKPYGNDYLSFSLNEKHAVLVQNKEVKAKKLEDKKKVG